MKVHLAEAVCVADAIIQEVEFFKCPIWTFFSPDEFAAHVGAVNCLALGHKSGRVMVTGGEDRKVNMWAIGKPNCILVS
jgi:hypothetical protein